MGSEQQFKHLESTESARCNHCALHALCLPALARFALFIKDISSHHQKRHLSDSEFDLPMARTDIADFLGLAPETISRLIASLTKKTVLKVEGKTVYILDKPALENACEALD